MASSTLGIRNNSFVRDHYVGKWSIDNNRSNSRQVVIGDRSRSRGIRKGRIMSSATTASLEPIWKNERGHRNGTGDAYERVDEWMKESVEEIVKNLREAPLLVQVYPKKKGNADGGETTALRTEKKAAVEDWPVVMKKWGKGETPLPEGVILVEELAEEGEEEGKERTTRAWGIVVQGRGMGNGPVCYLLKTSRVGSGPGMGMCSCTHFCLVRVKSFRETLKSQLTNCWLLQSQ
ncbi:uncharacterized protein G2W53_030530 [Senna tora]|uniref:DUF7804 domain-containing protein n=1 Tax=Senna tora TaxID=362788 RepID=A0A834WEN8_9FABA|nr:uncharacterized protein G2W53_030530 [Senna tora]